MDNRVATFLKLNFIWLMCVLFPQLWQLLGVAIALWTTVMGVIVAYKSVDQKAVENVAFLLLTCAVFWCLFVNLEWFYCYVAPTNPKNCGVLVAYAYPSNVLLLMALSWPMAMWLDA